ncbi:hypothetical protein JW887_05980 [Candidatus Dojkabacteria bacterium]|nr:hypothetical protein [Candidatus Dojkabacteria bacterium]
MSEYIIYNPAMKTSQKLSFFIGEDGLGIMSVPTNKECIEKFVNVLGIKEKIEKYSVKNCRTFYYSEYTDEGEAIADQWSYGVWYVQVEFAKKVEKIDWTKSKFYVDDVVAFEKEKLGVAGTEDPVLWFVISDFKSGVDLESAKKSLMEDDFIKNFVAEKKLKELSSYRSVAMSLSGEKFEQLITNLGEYSEAEFLEDCNDYRKRIMDICVEHGGEVNFLHTNR